MIVIEDDGYDKFHFALVGDTERLDKIPVAEYSAAEFWATKFFTACHEVLKQSTEVKTLNREERRK